MIEVVKIREVPNARYIGRPSPFGNPFAILDHGREIAIRMFIIYWYAPEQKWLRQLALDTIPQDAKLGCFCFPKSCHGDIIAGYINWRRL